MSFSSEVKEELSHVDGHENHCMIAELAAIIGLCGKTNVKMEDILSFFITGKCISSQKILFSD